MIVLTDEQEHAVESIIKDIKKTSRQEIVLGGHAGCGKTEIVKHLKHKLSNFAVCAFTGKAANVLRKKGLGEARTIHSIIYIPVPLPNNEVEFHVRDEVECDGFIVDEASMVNSQIYEDLKSFGKPIVFIGDHGQLEPVGNNPNIMKSPDYTLETVHRNAGEIAHFAEWIRLGNRAEDFKSEGKVKVVPAPLKKFVLESKDFMLKVDQIICAYNKTRVDLNSKMRKFLEFKNKVEVGERVMCLRNNRGLGLFNGMQAIVTKIHKANLFDIKTETGDFHKVPHHPKVWGTEKIGQDIEFEGTNPFDYSYAVTTHKAQGDEFDMVLVVEQVCKNWDHIRWAYTSASRAKEQLVWLSAPTNSGYDMSQKAAEDWF